MASTDASGNSFREMARTGRNLSGCLSEKCADVARILKPTALAAPTNGQSFVVFMTSFNGREERSEHTAPVMLNELNGPAVLQFASSDRKIVSRSSKEHRETSRSQIEVLTTQICRET